MPDRIGTHHESGAGRPSRSALLAAALCLVLATTACGGGAPPIFQGPREVGASVLLFQPSVRMGPSTAEETVDAFQIQVLDETRRALAGRGVTSYVESGPSIDALRAATEDLLDRMRRAGRRLRVGDNVTLGTDVQPGALEGAESVGMLILTRGAHAGADREYLPIPIDEPIENPEEEMEYKMPTPPPDIARSGVTLEFLMIGVDDGVVRLHRRVVDPAATEGEIARAIPTLVREATRGVRQ